MIRVLFVCLGNICRSPMAEGLFIHIVKEVGLSEKIQVDSCGIGGWHAGERPDPRMRARAAENGVHLPSRARQVRHSDFQDFHYIIAMDQGNLRDLESLATRVHGKKAHIVKMRAFDPQSPGADVPDPYYGDQSDFDDVFIMLDRSCRNLLDYIRKEHKI
ncbi:MAG: low molecular weight protein-tyrosine-phosphatase [Bacteroidia bacterium]|nr:low molecular weight protein-tyrosine-phosphatase [Bacteroidia bacterium]